MLKSKQFLPIQVWLQKMVCQYLGFLWKFCTKIRMYQNNFFWQWFFQVWCNKCREVERAQDVASTKYQYITIVHLLASVQSTTRATAIHCNALWWQPFPVSHNFLLWLLHVTSLSGLLNNADCAYFIYKIFIYVIFKLDEWTKLVLLSMQH